MEPTKTSKELALIPVFLAAVVLIAVLVVSYAPQRAKTLTAGEINEYQGQNLSSINDFRENSIKGPQYVDKTTYRLLITGLVSNALELNYEDVVNQYQSYKKVVTLNCVEGWSVDILWEGILVKDLLEEAGINPEAKVVIFYAYDDYSTSLPLDFITDNNILMAYKMNGVVLPPDRGFPFQLVAEKASGYKWIKWITRIELSDDVDYRGYWESRGFPNRGWDTEDFLEDP